MQKQHLHPILDGVEFQEQLTPEITARLIAGLRTMPIEPRTVIFQIPAELLPDSDIDISLTDADERPTQIIEVAPTPLPDLPTSRIETVDGDAGEIDMSIELPEEWTAWVRAEQEKRPAGTRGRRRKSREVPFAPAAYGMLGLIMLTYALIIQTGDYHPIQVVISIPVLFFAGAFLTIAIAPQAFGWRPKR